MTELFSADGDRDEKLRAQAQYRHMLLERARLAERVSTFLEASSRISELPEALNISRVVEISQALSLENSAPPRLIAKPVQVKKKEALSLKKDDVIEKMASTHRHIEGVAAAQVQTSESGLAAPKQKRRHLLAPLIEGAQKEHKDPFDVPAVWASLVKMAEEGKGVMMGVTEDGIKWKDANDEPRFFTLKNLRDWLYRLRKKSR